MKLSVTYTASETRQAAQIIALIREHIPGLKMRKSDRNVPFYHIYLTTRNPESPRKYKGNP